MAAMAVPGSKLRDQLRAETPPPRRRGAAEQDDEVAQQQWSAQPVGESDDWTNSPLPRRRDDVMVPQENKIDIILSPKQAGNHFMPARVDEDACFSSPKLDNHRHSGELGADTARLQAIVAPGMSRTPMKTPSRLPTVQEHEGQIAPVGEGGSDEAGEPAWVVQTPQTPAIPEDLGMGLTDPAQSATSSDFSCSLPKPTVKSTFIQFVSPLKTFSLSSPPKTEPVNFAPAASVATALFGDSGGGADSVEEALPGLAMSQSPGLAMSHSPMPWDSHDEIPFFPPFQAASSLPAAAEPDPVQGAMGAEARQRGPVVRLAEFFPEPPSSQWAPTAQPVAMPALDQSDWYMPSMPTLPMMSGADVSVQYAGFESTMAPMHDPMQAQVQMQELQPQLMQAPLMQPQQMQAVPQMQAQLPQMQMPCQMQPPQMQAQLPEMQMPPQMQPPQMQPPQMQATVQLQPAQMPPAQMPQVQMPASLMQPSTQPEQMLLQQLMQLQSQMHMQPQTQPQMQQPPTWPPLQPPQPVAGEQLPAPPPQAAPVEAPSVLCPSTCHQAGLCRCGEGKIGEGTLNMTSFAMPSAKPADAPGTGAAAPILLSAAMFPEMGSGALASGVNCRQ